MHQICYYRSTSTLFHHTYVQTLEKETICKNGVGNFARNEDSVYSSIGSTLYFRFENQDCQFFLRILIWECRAFPWVKWTARVVPNTPIVISFLAKRIKAFGEVFELSYWVQHGPVNTFMNSFSHQNFSGAVRVELLLPPTQELHFPRICQVLCSKLYPLD